MPRILRRIICIIFMIILNVLVIIGAYTTCAKKYQTLDNQKNAVLVGLSIDEKETKSEREIILLQLLRGEVSVEQCEVDKTNELCAYLNRGEELFTKYGYTSDDYYENNTKDFILEMGVIIVLLIIIDGLILIVFEAISQHTLRKNLNDLSEYFEKLMKTSYDLPVLDNSENEFSRLKNELYKVAVLLRETAENNIKSRRKLETALEDISHQLKTPLTALQITLDNLCTDKPLPKELQKEFLNTARRQVEHMTELIVTLLNLAKFDNKTIKLSPKDARISTLIDGAIEKVAVLAEIQDVKLVTEGDLAAKVHLDIAWQTEAISNIIKNCIEFSPEQESVLIRVEDCPLFTKIEISDHGPGISLSDQKHIFKRFYQTAGAKEGHVGIGLNFAKTVIEAELGRVTVKSTPKKGTKFTVVYPK